jgi:hypothetical protein
MSLTRPGDFSPYESSLKKNVYTLLANSRTGKNFYVAVKNSFAVPVLFNEKYPKMHEAAKLTLCKF